MSTFLDPAILFFIFGVFAGMVKSNLEIPQPIAKFLSLYLLMALGLKGGFALHNSGFTLEIALSLGLAVFLATIIPLIGYWFLKSRLNHYDAAALAATYGSVSAVTFITATHTLDQFGIPFGGHMATSKTEPIRMSKVLHESFTDGAQLLLLGAMVVGLITGSEGQELMAPFSIDLFKGMLAFFLLDMGLMAAKNFSGLKGKPPVTVAYAIVGPVGHALLALGLAAIFEMPVGDSILLMVLAASASYIAVPAVLRHALPEVNPALYMSVSLGITFPFNLIVGIPLYIWLANLVLT
jgi:hypothetical protein